jgi:FKBP-type peptidyl-prolyl cis-trans isomerase
MRSRLFTTAAVGSLALLAVGVANEDKKPESEPAAAAPAPTVELTKENISYAIGTMVGQSLKQQTIDVSKPDLMAGIEAIVDGKTPRLSQEQAMQVMQAFQSKAMAEQQAKASAEAGPMKEKAAAFLAENKKKKGVITTASGLQYEVIKEGKGDKPKASDTVKCHYHGTFVDGKVFDSSVERGQPAEFPLNGVIKGWTEGVPLMTIGSKYKFTIPYDLAYGAEGRPPTIPPASTLVFEIELLEIKK